MNERTTNPSTPNASTRPGAEPRFRPWKFLLFLAAIPVTATLAGIGVGLLIGLLLAGRGDRR